MSRRGTKAMRDAVHRCCPSAEQCIHYSVRTDDKKGPTKPGWCMVVSSWKDETYYVNISYCPFCGNKFMDGGKDFNMSEWEEEIRIDERKKYKKEVDNMRIANDEDYIDDEDYRGLKFSEEKIPNCPKCGSIMVKRINFSNYNNFWGCPNYPDCNGTRPYF